MTRLGFRSRLFLILSLFALVPAFVLTLAWGGAVSGLLPYVSSTAAWEGAAATGSAAIDVARKARNPRLTRAEDSALVAHQRLLERSVINARRLSLLVTRLVPVLVVSGLLCVAALWLGASRVAGHLSRQLSRPLHELVTWTERIRHGETLPAVNEARGAPEFAVLREGMREMARDLEAGRLAALEAERLAAFRESARQVAHELKNPLTPIRFAVARLTRAREQLPRELDDAVDVLSTESARLDAMARSFAQFGRLPEGPASDVDIAELVRSTARTTVPAHVRCSVDVEDGIPHLRAQHDAVSRALANVLLNGVEACTPEGAISVDARAVRSAEGRRDVVICVRDTGIGMSPERVATMWEPYVTDKPGGTGLGLAIVKQTVVAHGGRVEAESLLGHGTEIRLIFPVPAAPALVRGV